MEDVNNEIVPQDNPEAVSSTTEVATPETPEGADVEAGAVQENLDKPKSRANDRIRALNEQNKKLQQEFESHKKQYERAINLHTMLEQNPDKLNKVWEILQAKEEAKAAAQAESGNGELSEEELKQYDPVSQRLIRDNQELKKTVAELNEYISQQKQLETSDYTQSIDRHFESLVQKDGFLDEKGAFVKGLEEPAELLTVSTLGLLARDAKNPDRPTKEETAAAYKFAKSAMDNYAKHLMTKQKPTVPPSGTKQGDVPSGKKTYQSSVDHLAALL